jgi:hypothetical protein
MVPNESQKSCEFSATIKFRIHSQLPALSRKENAFAKTRHEKL